MSKIVSFQDYIIVACGVMAPELNNLKDEGFLNAKKIIYTTPGLHQEPMELEKQLLNKLKVAKEHGKKIIIVYGGVYCYVNMRDPERTIDKVIDEMREEGYYISRTMVQNCIDMVASTKEREYIAGGEPVWFGTPGWLKFRDLVFKGWDKAHANENFPQYTGGALLLDTVDFFPKYMETNPEDILDFSDWSSLPLDAKDVQMDRLKQVLIDAMEKTDRP